MLKFLVFLPLISCVLCFHLFRFKVKQRFPIFRDNGDLIQPDWLKDREEFEIFIELPPDDDFEREQEHVKSGMMAVNAYPDIDNLEERDFLLFGKDKNNEMTLAQMTVEDLSITYGFSIQYLGDYISSIGGPATINSRSKLGDILTGNQVYEVLQALHGLDPSEVNEGYMNLNMESIAQQYQKSYQELSDICKELEIPLPFGSQTVIHLSLYTKLCNYLDGGDGFRTEDRRFESDFTTDDSM
jgi:hypothetical protein